MGERAHPNDPGFRDRWVLTWRWKGRVPWPRYEHSPWKQGLLERYRFCSAYARGKRVVDVPCGSGWGTSMLQGARALVGVDLGEEAVRDASQRYGRRARFLVGDMSQLPLHDGSVDLVLCLEGIEHVPQEVGKAFVDEAARVLSPGGHVIVTSPIPDASRPPNPYHVHEYEPDELEAVFSTRFRRVRWDVKEMTGVAIAYYVGQVRARVAT